MQNPSLLFTSIGGDWRGGLGRRRRGILWHARCRKLICSPEREEASAVLIASRFALVNFGSSAARDRLQILDETLQILVKGD